MGQLMRFWYLSTLHSIGLINKNFERKIVNIFLPINLNIPDKKRNTPLRTV